MDTLGAGAARAPPGGAESAGRDRRGGRRSLDLRRRFADGSRVNQNILGRILLASSVCFAVVGCATSPKVISAGDGTYSVTRSAKTGFTLHADKLKAEALDDAAKFCAAHGKELKVVDVSVVEPPFYLRDIAKAKVVFKALDAGDPELRSEPVRSVIPDRPAPAVVAETPAPAAVVAGPLTTDELVSELTKLDDLRKKGILTDEEFQAEKKKVLSRSK